MTATEKYLALKALAPGVYLDCHWSGSAGRDDAPQWRVELPKVRTRNTVEPSQRSGATPEAAIEEAWYWLTSEAPPGSQRAFGPADVNEIIVERGEEEDWYRWDGFMWQKRLTQRRYN